MKKHILIIIVVFISVNTFGQAPSWVWAKSAGGNNYDDGRSIAVDGSGNSYVTGKFSSQTITFGTITLTNANNSGTSQDMYIVKYDANGTVLWAKSAGGSNYEDAMGIALDGNGYVYVTGNFSSSSIIFGNDTLNSGGNSNLFIVKYDTSGVVDWAKSAHSTILYCGNLAVDGSGNCYITGEFYDNPSVPIPTTFGNTNLFGQGSNDIFVVKYDSTGAVVWAKSAGGTGNDYGYSIALDGSGNCYVTGYFLSPTINFGSIPVTNIGSNANMFVVKYNTVGTEVWVRSADAGASESIAVDGSGNSYVTGYFRTATITFGSITLNNAGINSYDMFIVKYNTAGTLAWVKNAGGIADDEGSGITLDGNGNCYVTGFFVSPTIVFGSTTLTNADNSGTTMDMYIVKYDSSGAEVWAKSAGGNFDGDGGSSISTNASGDVFVLGDFGSPTITFGTATLTNSDNTGNTGDIFIAKLGSTTEIEEIEKGTSFTISPNPFTSETTITFSSEQKNTTIKIMDVVGKEILKQVQNDGKTATLDMSGYAKGMYILRIENEKKNVVNRKVIKE